MYTLRIFKDKSKISRTQIFLGDTYVVEYDIVKGVKLRVYGNSPNLPDDGIAIHDNQYAFIMTSSGQTFETLNRPMTIDLTIDKNTPTPPVNLLNEFFNSKSDANKYLDAQQQEELESEFDDYVKSRM